MKFSEEYKAAMNEISPDDKAAQRIERAVMSRIAEKSAGGDTSDNYGVMRLSEKPAKSGRKTPVFIGTAISGAAVCAALACVFIFRTNGFSGGSSAVNAASSSKMFSQDFAANDEIGNLEDSIAVSSSMIFNEVGSDNYYSSAELPASGTKAEQCTTDGAMSDVVWDGENAFALEFTADGGVIVKKGDYCEEFEQTCLVERYNSPQKDLFPAITEDGEKRFIRIDGYRLYLFDDDLQTAKRFNKK